MTDSSALADGALAPDGVSRRVALAWTVRMVPWMLAAASVVLLVVVRPAWDTALGFYAVDAMVAVVYGAVAGLLIERRPHPVTWILAVMAAGCGLSAFAAQYVLLGLESPGLPWLGFFGAAIGWGWTPGTIAAIVAVPWLVARQPLPRLHRVAAGVGLALAALMFLDRLTEDVPFGAPNPFAMTWGPLQPLIDFVAEWGYLLTVVLGLAAAAGVAWRWRRGPVEERRGLGWLAIGQTIMAVTFVPIALPDSDLVAWLPLTFVPVSHLVAQAFLPVALLVVILRQQLWGIDVAVNRATVWGLLTLGTVATYVVVVAVVTWALPLGAGGSGVVAAAVIALAFQPFRGWVQQRVDRLVYGAAAEPVALFSGVSDRLRTTSQHAALTGLAESLASSMRLAYVAIRSDDPAAPGLVATAGAARPAELEVPLEHSGTTIGALLVAPEPGERLDGRAVQLLREVAGFVAVALQLSQLNLALERSRDRLVEVREQERRALRRDLHDGLGPALAGMGLAVGAARTHLAGDPERAAALLTEVEAELGRRTEDVRSLARTVLPPALDERGLLPALEELGARFTDDRLRVEVRADDAAALTVPQQVGIYLVAAEAVLNARKHAGASHVTVDLRVLPDGWVLEVGDDGTGIDEGAGAGVGLTSMRERADELGATVTLDTTESGGCRVRLAAGVAAALEDPA